MVRHRLGERNWAMNVNEAMILDRQRMGVLVDDREGYRAHR
jgi:hypothetical protein